MALLFGSEKRGLSNADFSHCHWLVHVPTREEHTSMNLGQAVAVCLYELARSSTKDGNRTKGKAISKVKELKTATAGELERITTVLIDALRASGYLGERSVVAKEEKIRRMVRRMELSSSDAELWLGILRQMLWKMKTPENGQ